MKPTEFPIVAQVIESGAQDRVFDALLLVGPPVILLIAAVGRSALSIAVAVVYLLAFVGHVLTNGLKR
jgi:hypothetical protein